MKWALGLILGMVALPGFGESFDELAEKCAPSVSPDTLNAIVRTESGFNPLAIAVVGGKVRQPETLQEAVFIATELATKQKSFSVGLAQINSQNFQALGVTAEELFDPCTNLKAASVILGKCYERMSREDRDPARALSDALSCYYSGNAVTGHEHGYVDRVISNAPPVRVPSIRLLTDGNKGAAESRSGAAEESSLISQGTQGAKRRALIF